MSRFDGSLAKLITLSRGWDGETNVEPLSRPATLLALTDARHNPAEKRHFVIIGNN